jgi:hypothetical protein
MEFTVEGEINGVPFLGKPDLQFVVDLGAGEIQNVWDFKVHGFCSKYGASPTKGYALCRDGQEGTPTRSHLKCHANYLASNHKNMLVNSGWMEHCSKSYADQLTLYGWLMGEQVGDENVVLGIEEILGKYTGGPPRLRIANHRGRVSRSYQLSLADRMASCWQAITSGYIFQDMTREENDSRCEVLNDMAKSLVSGGGNDDWFATIGREKKWG